jgi:class 3 adenylate cyclase/CheY-like chemotaxis protein
MAPQDPRDKLAFAARVSQKLNGPSEAIVGFLTLLTDEVRRSGPADALEDLEKVSGAAARLSQMIQKLIDDPRDISLDEEFQSQLRHDLRSPINAIIGYSEMILEDFLDVLDSGAVQDIKAILTEARRLVVRVDEMVDGAAPAENDLDASDLAQIATRLARSLDVGEQEAEGLTGKILVIDDEAPNREILTRQLEKRGHSVTAVGSAVETFQAMRKDRFDLLLLDILMPETNGIEVLKRLKSEPDSRDIPVVMVSGLLETGAIARCIASGAEDYLPKPIDPILLHARVQSCLEKSRWRAREVAYAKEVKFERDRADTLLHAMLPAPVIQRLNSGETQIADRFVSATIVFADIVDFTPLVARMDAGDLVRELSSVFTAFDDLANHHGIEKIKTIGDAYMAASGIPEIRDDHAIKAVDFARDIIKVMSDSAVSRAGLQIRVGIHSGPVIAGLIGRKRSVYDVWGETVNLASRLESTGQAGRIQISGATKSALGGSLKHFREHEHDVKGVGRMTSYFID